jgi:hypothetical protein
MNAIVALEACIMLGLNNESSDLISQVIELMYDEEVEDDEDIVDTVIKINRVINDKLLKYKESFHAVIHGVFIPQYTITKHSDTQLLLRVSGKDRFGGSVKRKYVITQKDMDYLDEIQEELDTI